MKLALQTMALGSATPNLGKAETLGLLMGLEFGTLSDTVQLRLASASDAELDLWLRRVLFAETAEELLCAD
jgi:hypothetical protein